MKNTNDISALVLRVGAGGLMLLNGIAKGSSFVASIGDQLVEMGLPAFLANGVYVGEIIAPIFIILGLGTRLASFVLVMNMLTAIAIQHSDQIFSLSGSYGGWTLELQGLYIIAGISLLLTGGGRFALSSLMSPKFRNW